MGDDAAACGLRHGMCWLVGWLVGEVSMKYILLEVLLLVWLGLGGFLPLPSLLIPTFLQYSTVQSVFSCVYMYTYMYMYHTVSVQPHAALHLPRFQIPILIPIPSNSDIMYTIPPYTVYTCIRIFYSIPIPHAERQNPYIYIYIYITKLELRLAR